MFLISLNFSFKIVGILHLDSYSRIETFKEKDISLIRTLAHQAAVSIENSSLLEEIETELRIVDQLGRFLPPQVVNKVVSESRAGRR